LQFTQTDAELGGFISKRGPVCGESFFGITLVRVVCHYQPILRASGFWSPVTRHLATNVSFMGQNGFLVDNHDSPQKFNDRKASTNPLCRK
jgi:hypothetical protein